MQQDRYLSNRIPVITDRRGQREPRIGDKNEMGCQPRGILLNGAEQGGSILSQRAYRVPRPAVLGFPAYANAGREKLVPPRCWLFFCEGVRIDDFKLN